MGPVLMVSVKMLLLNESPKSMSGVFFPVPFVVAAIGKVHESKSLFEIKMPSAFKEISVA